jgi:hypothetical protein
MPTFSVLRTAEPIYRKATGILIVTYDWIAIPKRGGKKQWSQLMAMQSTGVVKSFWHFSEHRIIEININ